MAAALASSNPPISVGAILGLSRDRSIGWSGDVREGGQARRCEDEGGEESRGRRLEEE